jgi:predicted metallo-beta-lactamase superfamily hydrolase
MKKTLLGIALLFCLAVPYAAQAQVVVVVHRHHHHHHRHYPHLQNNT